METINGIEMQPVESSNIAAVGYNEVQQAMRVQFTSGDTYHYDNVPKDVFEAFHASKSKGRFFASEIRTKPDVYKARKVVGDRSAPDVEKDIQERFEVSDS